MKTTRSTQDDAPMSVLLIVDRGMFAEAIGSVLAHRNVEVLGIVDRAADVAEAAERTRPDVVVVDMESHLGRGLDVARTVRKAAPGAKVIALTPQLDNGLAYQVSALGFHGSLTKDVDTGALVTAIRRVADGETVAPPARPRRTSKRWSHERHDELLISQLTPRELEVIRLMAKAASSQEIARRLSISVNTVRSHIQSIFTKLQVHSRLGAVAFAASHDLLSPPEPIPYVTEEADAAAGSSTDQSTG
jgi:DNA-binding NarL/FixJ family response regulator